MLIKLEPYVSFGSLFRNDSQFHAIAFGLTEILQLPAFGFYIQTV